MKQITKLKLGKAAVILAAIIMTQAFYMSASANSDNTVTGIANGIREYDYSTSSERAPRLLIESNLSIASGASFILELSDSAKWTYSDMAGASPLFTFNGSTFTSDAALTNETGFTYTVEQVSDSEVKITTNAALPEGKKMYIPIIASIDSIKEATVTIYDAAHLGITEGTYVFANEGRVESATLEARASGKVYENTVTADLNVSISAGLGDATLELTAPKGFLFSQGNRSNLNFEGRTGYADAKIGEIFMSPSNETLYIRIDKAARVTTESGFTIKNITLTALENAAEGSIGVKLSIPSYGISNKLVSFGVFTKSAQETSEETPAQTSFTKTIFLTVGNTWIFSSVTGGQPEELSSGAATQADTAPYNDENGRMMVPLRFITQAFGMDNAAVSWNAELKQATFTFNYTDQKIIAVFTADSNIYLVNGEQRKMDTTAVIKDSRMFVPARFAADALGFETEYREDSQTAVFSREL